MPDTAHQPPYYSNAPVALVIGCGDMGVGCARVLGRRRPLLLADIDSQRLEASVASLADEGYLVSGTECDITDPASVRELAGQLSGVGGVEVLAHVAAVAGAAIGWRRVMEVDLLGAHRVADAVSPAMQPGGVAVLISSTGSYQCPVDARIESLLDAPLQPGFIDKLAEAFGREPDFLEAYFMAKQGINRLARRLALEWGPRQIRAVSVSPGLINTSMGRTSGAKTPLFDGQGNKHLVTRDVKAAREVPLGRQGSVLEIVDVVDFLASGAASFITGIDIPVDGGSTARLRSLGLISR
ncbi:SDR family NAD(P)-dependent oxidoreductase [Haliea sp. E17]|uniref:SDR family NAD(P)-dependent oxidoreductase n=1 Tax=Haliea sp. E17 TaxID=3401576 RepID=UPI003AAA5724